MGCDWIDAGSSFVGIVWSFEEIFDGTKFETEEVKPDYLYKEGDSSNPFSSVVTAWDSFLEKKYPEVRSLGIKPIIGCYSMPLSYEKIKYSNSCNVVFGYQLISAGTKEPEDTNGVLEYQFSSKLRFPKNFSELVDEFVFDFRAESNEEKSTSSSQNVKKAKKDIREIEIVNFLS